MMNSVNFAPQQRTDTSIFQEHWWFDAATPGAWDIREVRRDNRVVASFPFVVVKKLNMRYVQMPELTRTLEPQITIKPSKPVTRLKHRIAFLAELLALLPKHDRFEMCLPPDTEYSLPFVQLGYTNTVKFTFRSTNDSDDAWSNLEQRTRTLVSTARKLFTIEEHRDVDRFVRVSKKFLAGERDRNDYASVARIFEACEARGRSVILSAVNETGQDSAAAILVWDDNVLYFWMTARDPATSGNSANALLTWRAYEIAKALGRVFDIDGFNSLASASHVLRFGFQPAQRTFVTNYNPLWSTLFSARALFSASADKLNYR